MHTNNIELLRDEAQRLLRLNIEGLGQMMAATGVITKAEEGSQQTFDHTSTPKYIEILKGELTKLENMELVIAVVGTMKAGKSTTINAIVGTEVLPNRNRPMTALPTLIRHTPGQIEPILQFENNEPINVLFDAIRKQMATGKVNELLQKLSSEKDMQELISNITSKQTFGKQYQGAANIFCCLKTLNDLVRLSNDLDVAFPFSSYANVDQMPVITVEFAHLREAGKTHGQLTLLDTPGPNESGQDHLRDMLTEQLKKTSAVLAIFDYTQLKSDADEHVRNEIKSIAQLHKGRLFALVNKFDQKDCNSDGKEAVQALVADKLMDGLLDRKHVFPVSSMLSYLANRAKHEIATNKALPAPEKEHWVADFAEKAFGSLWETDDINDNDSVMKSADKLWKKSGFHEPMENVIRAAHTKAALLSIDSAAEKLVKCANDVENFLGARRGALSQSAESLQQRISDLKHDMETVENMENAVQEDIELTFKSLEDQTKETVINAKEIIKEEMAGYFDAGMKIEKEESESKQQEIKKQRGEWEKKNPFGAIFSKHYSDKDWHRENMRHFDPNENYITFRDKKKAEMVLENIQKSSEEAIANQRNILNGNIGKILKYFRDDFDKVAKSAKQIIVDINSSMANDGFRISLKLPTTNKLDAIFRIDYFSLDDKLGHKTVTESYTVKKDGLWSGFTNWLNDDWGRESRTREVDEFVIDMPQIRKIVNEGVDKTFGTYSVTMESEITKPLKLEVDAFFVELRATIENIRGNLQQGIRDQQNDRVELEALAKCLDQFLSNIMDVTKDSNALNEDVKFQQRDMVAA